MDNGLRSVVKIRIYFVRKRIKFEFLNDFIIISFVRLYCID